MNTEIKTKRMYVIKNGKGLFSSGGIDPRFGPRGKVWDTAGKLRNHLAMFRLLRCSSGKPHYECTIPEDWRVVEIEVRFDECACHDAREFWQNGRKERA